MSRVCTGCGKALPLSSFHRDSRAKAGRRSRCSACVSAASIESSKKPPVVDPAISSKCCPRCGEDLPLASFGVARRMVDGRNSWCRDCCSEATRAWQRTDSGRAKHAEAVKRYRERKRLLGA